jgi:hypothetical protein
MKVLKISITAAMLSLANVAFAEEPMTLTDAQMDGVSAGYAYANIGANAYGSGSVSVSGSLNVNDNYYYPSASAYVTASVYPSGYMSVNLSASSSAY